VGSSRQFEPTLSIVSLSGRALGAALVVGFLGSLLACKTAPPPPPPEPVPVEVATQPPPPPAPVFVKVTGSKLNVRESAGTNAAIVAKLKKGDRLQVLTEQDGWFQVQLPASKSGWVAAQYVSKEQPCLADKPGAELLNEPSLSISESGPHGRVVLEATVSAQGVVASTKLVQNTTGSAELEKRATDELRQLRFSPPIRRCTPISFIYTYTRSF
jgi:TonB family protein